jgi:hypothetical protein
MNCLNLTRNPRTLKSVKDAETPIDYWNHNHDISTKLFPRPKKKHGLFLLKKSLQQLQVILSRIIAGIFSQCEIITYNFLRAKSPQLLPFLVAAAPSLPREGHQEHHRTPPHTHVSPHWRPRSDVIIKPTARIWLTHRTDGQDLTNWSNRRPRSDQMIIILPIKKFAYRTLLNCATWTERSHPSVLPGYGSFPRTFPYPKKCVVDEKLFICRLECLLRKPQMCGIGGWKVVDWCFCSSG